MAKRRRETLLARWKRERALTWEEAAKVLGIKADYLRKLGCGMLAVNSPHLARQIERKSGGAISAVGLMFPERADSA
jgi:hypothetical protein